MTEEEPIGFEQDAYGLYVKMGGIGRLIIVDCDTIEWDDSDDVLVILRCSRKKAGAEPGQWEKIAEYQGGKRIWRHRRTGERKTTWAGEEP